MTSIYFNNYRWVLSCAIFILLNSCSSASDDAKDKELRNAVSHLVEGIPPEVVMQNLYLLERTGTAAFPILIEAVDDNRNAAGSLQEARGFRQENGKAPKLYVTQVGDVALSLFRSKIEGDRPGSCYSFYVLKRSNIKQWLAERAGKSLTELRVDAAKQALKSVKDTYSNSSSDDAMRAIFIFEKRINEIENGASPDIE